MENLVITINGLEYVQKSDTLNRLQDKYIALDAIVTEKNNKINELEQKIAELEDSIEELETNCEILSFENSRLLQGFDKIESILGNIL